MLVLVTAALAGPHAAQVAAFGSLPRRPPAPLAALPPPTPGPDLRVYGYLAWWNGDLYTVPWDQLTDLGVFDASANADGTLSGTTPWDAAAQAVAIGAPYGVRIDLVVTSFDGTTLSTLLSSASHRNTLIGELASWQAATGAHGINVDFENLPASVKSEFVTFIADLETAVGAVSLAGPAVDWAGAYDYSELTRYADIFVMGYGYHWSGSNYAGPQDPMYAGSGTIWEGIQSYSLTWTIDDYLKWGGDPSRLILGLPLYGMSWPVGADEVPAVTAGSGTVRVFADAWTTVPDPLREDDSRSLVGSEDGEQWWFGDAETVRERIAHVRDQTDFAGVGFWALHYDGDDPEFWAMVHDETTFAVTTPPTGPVDSGSSPETTADTGTGEADEACGCGHGTGGGPAPLAVAWLLLRGRRPERRHRSVG